MENSNRPFSPVRFGKYEVDFGTGELRLEGIKVRLQQQPFQVLAALLARPGQLVSREEIRRLVWNNGTFVDFERGLNKAVNRLRDALGDTAAAPRFIETLSRRGYRFVAPISRNIQSLAVLPFKNFSGDPKQEHWADGMADELIARLGLLTGLRVVSHTSAIYFKANPAPLPEIAMRLSVDSVIEGSVAISRRKIRIAVQLIDAFHDRVLWAETYERSVDDVITIQGEIARAIALKVRARLTPREQIILAGVRPSKSAAYESYLKGRFFWDKRTEPSLNSAVRYFKRAAILEAEYAPAHAGLADSYVVLGILGLVPPCQAFPKAKAAVETALQIDDTLGEAHATLGHIRMTYDWDWSGAEKEFKRAIELNTNYAIAHQWYGNLLTIMRRNQEAIAELNIARDLDPLSIPVNTFLAFGYMRARKYDCAIEACRSAIELDANNPFGHWILARVFDANEELSKALTEAKRAVTLSKRSLPFAAHLGYAYARSGDEFQARRIINELVSSSKKRYVSPYLIAMIYVGLGDRTGAFEWLGKAFADRTPRLSELPDPPFAKMRSDRRFERLVQRVGLPAA